MSMRTSIEVVPSDAPLGAEVVGVDLAQELDEQTFQTIETASSEHLVLVFRNQQLTPADFLRFARRFGELEISPRTQFALPDDPEILVLSNILDAEGNPIGNADAGRTWHTDMSYIATPPRWTMLYAVEVPQDVNGEALGDTLFVSATAAYEALPVEMKTRLEGLQSVHRGGAKQYAPGSRLAEAIQDLPDVIHPVIRTHPVTGRKAIYVREGECVGLVGMRADESLPLIKELSNFVTMIARSSARPTCNRWPP